MLIYFFAAGFFTLFVFTTCRLIAFDEAVLADSVA